MSPGPRLDSPDVRFQRGTFLNVPLFAEKACSAMSVVNPYSQSARVLYFPFCGRARQQLSRVKPHFPMLSRSRVGKWGYILPSISPSAPCLSNLLRFTTAPGPQVMVGIPAITWTTEQKKEYSNVGFFAYTDIMIALLQNDSFYVLYL